MKYCEAIDLLNCLDSKNIKLGLERIIAACDALGNPEKKFPSIIVAGTNGKGSTCAFLESLLRHSGLKVGLYISPHLNDVRERIQIDRELISETDFSFTATLVQKTIFPSPHLPISLTYFEFLTAIAFQYFAEQKIDIAVLEVGLGGRFDATNVVTPLVSIITRIGIDHQKYLGDTIDKIAFEKAGIIKEGVPVVTISQDEAAMDVIRCVADEKGSILHVVSPAEVKWKLGLLGRHQVENAALALRAFELIREAVFPLPLLPSPLVLQTALASTTWPGRLEVVSQDPLVILDGAHNPNGAEALARYIREEGRGKKGEGGRKREEGRRKKIVMLGIMADKDINGIIGPLAKVADEIILTRPSGERAADPLALRNVVPTFRSGKSARSKDRDYPIVKVIQPLSLAIEQTLKTMPANSALIIAGSLYTVGEARKYLLARR